MKNFLKYTLATIVGIMIVHVILFFIFIGFIGAIASFSEKTVTVKNNSILTIKLEGEILDRTSDNPLDNIDFLSFTPKKNLGLNKILASIQKAAKDSRIQGIYLDLTEIQGNFGALAFTQEIRNALQKFKESGKFIYSYSNLGYSQKSYYLATVADKIFVNPETPLLLTGMSSSISFYKETLAKLGIQPEVVKVGKFKSAVEPFISDEMSPANREQVQKYLDSSWGTIVQGIAENRNIIGMYKIHPFPGIYPLKQSSFQLPDRIPPHMRHFTTVCKLLHFHRKDTQSPCIFFFRKPAHQLHPQTNSQYGHFQLWDYPI